MSSLRMLSNFIILLVALIGTACADADHPPSILKSLVLRLSVHQITCRDNTECISGCVCWSGSGIAGRCVNTNLVKKILLQCRRCSTSADCSGVNSGCSAIGFCQACTGEIELNGTTPQRLCQPSPSKTKNTQRKCTRSSDCTRPGCQCNSEAGNQCYAPFVFVKSARACKQCRGDHNCPNSSCHSSKKCLNCLSIAFLDGVSACHTQGSKPSNPHNSPTSHSNAHHTASRGSNPAPQNFTEVVSTAEGSAEPNSTAENSAVDKHSTATVCIATSWLRQRGLEHAAIRHAGVINVLCIPGLPCGTSGHLLRECISASGECQLVTYREACERRRDCVESATDVSQLSHTFDWSRFKAAGVSEGTTLELTSLSAHPLSRPSSPSRLIAYVADHLNTLGLGRVCNAVAVLLHRLRATLRKELVRESSDCASAR